MNRLPSRLPAASALVQDGALGRSPAIAGDLLRHHDAPLVGRKTASLPPLALAAYELGPLRPHDGRRQLGDGPTNDFEPAHGSLLSTIGLKHFQIRALRL